MSEGSASPKPPKRIRLGKLPYVLGIGGSKESKDMKLMFIEKATNKHYTFRTIVDQDNGRLTFEMHATDEDKKHKAIQEGKATRGAYDPLIRMILDLKALEKDAEKLMRLVEDIHGVEDLDRQGYVAAAVQGGNRIGFGALFKKEGRWYYLDMLAYGKEALLLFEPYLTIEGKMTKEEFIGALKADTQLARLPAAA